MLLFLKLYLAHLIADLIIRPNSIAQTKRQISRSSLHFVVHLGTALVLINIHLSKNIFLILLLLALLHAASDYVKTRFTRNEWLAFTADQAVHLLLIALAAILLSANPVINGKEILRSLVNSEKLYLYASIFIAVTVGGGYFVQKITQYFMQQIDQNLVQEKPGLPNAGKYIGWLERSLVLTFIVAGYPDGVGLLLAAKALARYPEIKNDVKGHFAEYFLIGTLTSVSIALLAGFILLKVKSKIAN